MIVFYFLPFLGSLASNNLRTSNLSYHEIISVSLVKTPRIYKMQNRSSTSQEMSDHNLLSYHLITYVTLYAPVAPYLEVHFGSVNDNRPMLSCAKLCAIMSPSQTLTTRVLKSKQILK